MKPDTTFAIIAIIVAIVVTASTVSNVAYAWDPSGNSASPFSPGKGTGEPPGQTIGPSAPNAPGHVKAAPQ